jgi:hypothetical protein
MRKVFVQQVTKAVPRFSRISGHRWADLVPTNRWEVSGPYGSIRKCHTEARAIKVAEEYKAFYDKFPQQTPPKPPTKPENYNLAA